MSFSLPTVIIILVLGVLFFGKNLPEVARQIGSALMEFRKGVDEWKDLGKSGSNEPRRKSASSGTERESTAESPDNFESLGTKFEPPEG